MNSFQFNIFLGLISLVGFTFLPEELLSFFPKWCVAVFFILLYASEFWAFLYKIRIARVKQLYDLSKGNPSKRIGEIEEPGCMLFYAFLMRFVFRFAMIMLAITFFNGGDSDKEIPNWGIVFMIIVVLFELFNMMYSLYETHIFRLKTDDDGEMDEEEYWVKEKDWRTKMFKKLNAEKESSKLFFADLIILLSSSVITMLFWQGSNQSFIEFIKRSATQNESTLFVVLTVLISSAILCLFFLMPVKLAFWLEQKMHIDTVEEKRKYRLSILFAGISITAPSWIQLIKTFILNV